MKRLGLIVVLTVYIVSAIFAAQYKIIIKNTSKFDRCSEMVEANICNINGEGFKYVLKDLKGEEVPYQYIFNNKNEATSIIFQVDVKANSSASFLLTEGKPSIVKSKTFGRFVPERRDDFAWENDLCAYRMYGPALANENPSNGVDLWLKRTEDLVINQRYHDEIINGLSYHVDHGNGLDCYSVGHTMGAGGIAPFYLDSLWIGNHYDHYKVIENGPLRTVFMLTYDSVKVGNNYLKQEITITTTAGSLLNKAEVKYTGNLEKIKLATGIFLHDSKGKLNVELKNGTLGYAENAFIGDNISMGRNYVGVYVPSKVNSIVQRGQHIFALGNYKLKDRYVYYFGGGWSKWKFATDDDWFDALKNFAKATKEPLKLKISYIKKN